MTLFHFFLFHIFSISSILAISSSIPSIFSNHSWSFSFWITFCSICLTLSLVTSNSSHTCSRVYLGQSIPYLILIIFDSLSSSIERIVSKLCLNAFFSAN